MVTFYAISALLISLALGFLLWPLLGKNGAAADLANRQSALKQELTQLMTLQADGLIAAQDFETKRLAISERALNLLAPSTSAAPPRSKLATSIAALLLVVLPIAVMATYRHIGKPHALTFNTTAQKTTTDTAGAAPTNATGMDLNAAAAGLAERLAANPDDGDGWMLLGRTYLELNEQVKARDAFAKGIVLVKATAEDHAQYGESIGMAERPNPPPPAAEAQIDMALNLDGSNQRALWLKGMFRRIAGDNQACLQAWEKLATTLPAGTELADALQQQIDDVKAILAKSTPASDTPSVATAVQGPSLRVQIDVSPALKASVAPNDVLFVFAKAKDGPPMPIAIQRLAAKDLPMSITLDDSNAMMPEMKLSAFADIVVGARISKTGTANASAGDLESALVVGKSDQGESISLLIDQVRK